MKTEIERYKEAVELARNELFALATLGGITSIGNVQAKEALAKINAILNPPVEMEDVPIERWAVLNHNGEFITTRDDEADARRHIAVHDRGAVCKLTGTLTRPKPVKVERSVSVQVSNIGVVWNEDGTPCHEVCGKKCILTFEVSQ